MAGTEPNPDRGRPRTAWRRLAAGLLIGTWLGVTLEAAAGLDPGLRDDTRRAAPGDGGIFVLPTVLVTPPPHPLDGLSRRELECRVALVPAELGTASLGAPNRGALFNGVAFESNHLWQLESPENAWATPETIAALRRAVEQVHRLHPNTSRLHLGDASRPAGGTLRPHRSHQAGRDVDVGFFYTTGPAWYAIATADNLDRPRTWTFLRALLAEGEVESVFLDHRVQSLLLEHATQRGEDPSWLESVFGGTRRNQAPIRHARGHRTHLHVRFRSHQAVETGLRLAPFLSLWSGRPTVPAWRCAPSR